MTANEKHVSFDEERYIKIIEEDGHERQECRETKTGFRKVAAIVLLFFLGIFLTAVGVQHCGLKLHRHVHRKFVHLVASPQSLEPPKLKANVYVGNTKTPELPEPFSIKKAKRADNASVCSTPACLDYAKAIKATLARNYTAIDPCTDFSTYACDGWRQSHDYRSDQAGISVSSLMSDAARAILRQILENPYPDNITMSAVNKSIDRANFEKMKLGYATCMNEDKIKDLGVEPVRKILDEFENYYPRSKPAGVNEKDELTKALIWLSENSVNGFVSPSVGVRARKKPDDKHPEVNIIALGGAEVGLGSKEYYNNTKILGNYKKSIAQLYKVIWSGEIMSFEDIAKDAPEEYSPAAEKIIQFETKLARASPDPDLQSEIGYYYNIAPIEEIEKKIPQISLITLLNGLKPSNYTIKTVINTDPWYYGNISSILQATPRETLYNYFQFRLISAWAGRLHKDYTRPSRVLGNSLSGRAPDAIAERWRTCVGEVDRTLGWLLSSAYIERAFSAEAKQLGDRIVSDIKKEFSGRLKNANWMSAKTQEVAAKKVVSIIQKIGYPTKSPNVADPDDLRKYYNDLEITNNYFQNGRNVAKFGQKKTWSDLAKPVDKARWGMSAPTVNAYYNPSGNEIVFPAGIMQLPVFSDKLPEYVSYGAFGAVAGHEITHGFDNNGAHYDQDGVYADWWDNSTVANFDKKTKCFVDQFSKYTVTGLDGKPLHINGKLTLGENIADAGGLSASYAAWERRDKQSPERNQIIAGLEGFTKEQLFFVSYSNWWCGKMRGPALVNQVLTDPHSPADKRILGTLANSRAFKEAFQCKVKEPTCELW